METNNYLRRVSWQDMRTLMKRQFLAFALEEGRDDNQGRKYDDYHMVRFYR